jgi:DNA-binding LacI/PurR family transcriptional regulator
MPRPILDPIEPWPRGRPPVIDWTEAAELLAEGMPAALVATRLGCSRQTVWRALRRSRALQEQLGEMAYRQRAETGSRLHALRPLVARALERKLDEGNTRVILWLAQRLGVANHGYPEIVPRDLVDANAADHQDATRVLPALEPQVEHAIEVLARLAQDGEDALIAARRLDDERVVAKIATPPDGGSTT